MGTSSTRAERSLAAAADVIAKALTIGLLALVVVNPEWGNLEGKAPVARALTYPLVAFVVPVVWWLRGARSPYPWLADVLYTLPGFTDVLGNRLDLYDTVWWFDDLVHVLDPALLCAAVLLLTVHKPMRLLPTVTRSVAAGMTMSLGWELFEFVSFVTRSREHAMAYEDTLGDLANGWVGSVLAGVAFHYVRRRASRRAGVVSR